MSGISKIANYYRSFDHKRIHQGDILKDVTISCIVNKNEKIDSSYPYIVIMTQDCDLLQDYKNRTTPTSPNKDKYLMNILVCPAFPSNIFISGDHLDGFPRQAFSESETKDISRNDKFKRYHFLKGDKAQGLTDLIVDFKLFITLDREEAYALLKTNFVASIEELFRDSLMQRFSNFLSRIPLPVIEEKD